MAFADQQNSKLDPLWEPPTAARVAELLQRIAACGRVLRHALAKHATSATFNDSEFLLLWTCHRAGGDGTAQCELASAAGLSPGQVSGVVERLRVRGLLRAHRPAADRRRQLWQLTGAGQDLVEQSLREMLPAATDISAKLDAQSQQILISLLDRLAAALTDPPALRVVPTDSVSSDQPWGIDEEPQ
jgi:DNA-binding MarR family transcriptional regulator